jgi:2'-5' RNA ligase
MGCELTDEGALRQLHFEGLEPQKTRRFSPRFRSKLLLLLKPPPALAERIFADASHHSAGRTRREAYPAELLHITLMCIGCFDAIPRGLITSLKAALAEVRARPVPITLDGSSLFGNRNSLVLQNSRDMPEIDALVKMLQRALWRANLPYIAASSFMPHLTMIYGCGKIEPMPAGKPYSWLAGNFELVFSHNGEARHESLGRFALSAKADRYEPLESQLPLPEKVIGPPKRANRKLVAR